MKRLSLLFLSFFSFSGPFITPVFAGAERLQIMDITDFPDPFSPNGDGRLDTVTITTKIKVKGTGETSGSVLKGTVSIKDSAGTEVNTLYIEQTISPVIGAWNGLNVSASWDGKDKAGSVVPDGTYSYTLSLRLIKGCKGQGDNQDDPNSGKTDLAGDCDSGQGNDGAGEDVIAVAGPVSGRIDVDITPPAIAVDGIRDGEATNRDVAPSVTVNDLHPYTQSITLDGQTFASGSAITHEGRHTLVVTASDMAGNTAGLSLSFTIDKTPPEIRIASPQNGATVNSSKPSVSVEYSDALSGIDRASARLAIDGIDVTDGALISDTGITYAPDAALKDGLHTITASASDKARNTADTSLSFTIKTRQRPFIFPEPAFYNGSYDLQPPWNYSSEMQGAVDFNGDGILDVLMLHYKSKGNAVGEACESRSKLSLILGKGDGRFGEPTNIMEISGRTGGLGIGDFNGDGYPDIFMRNLYHSSSFGECISGINFRRFFNTLINNGDGTFSAGPSQTVDRSVFYGKSLVGDFNKDGYKDIAIIGNNINMLLGKGDGSFSEPVKSEMINILRKDNGYYAVIDAIPVDVNRDGITDIVVTTYGTVSNSAVVLFVGTGDGGFLPPKLLEVLDPWSNIFNTSRGGWDYYVGLAASDMDKDGNIDIVLTTSGQGDYPSGLVVLAGDGSGGFVAKEAQNFNIDFHYTPLKVADFNKDGISDIMVQGYYKAYMFPGKGDATFADPVEVNISGDYGMATLTNGDVDNDGAIDIISHGYGRIYTVFGKGDGTFIDNKTLPAIMRENTAIVSSDFDGDGAPDIAAVSNNGPVSIILNRGSGSKDPSQDGSTYKVGDGPVYVKLGDLNEDGWADVVTVNELSGDVTVMLNKGGILEKKDSYRVGDVPGFCVLEDINEDGHLDIITANAESRDLSILLGNGDGSFSHYGTIPDIQCGYSSELGGWTCKSRLIPGDFNNDGKTDIIAIGNPISVLLGIGDGRFQPKLEINLPVVSIWSVAKGDFNEDGYLDIASLTGSGLNILFGRGDGTFGNRSQMYIPTDYHYLLATDMNRDGHIDLLSREHILWGDGTGKFRSDNLRNPIYAQLPIISVDINGDGYLDIMGNTYYSGGLEIWLGQNNGEFTKASIGELGNSWVYNFDLGDINGDGIADIALVDYNNLIIIRGNGDGSFPGETIQSGEENYGMELAAADFNGDNNQDIVARACKSYTCNITVFLGNGYNSFKKGPSLETQVSNISTADFNEDGLPDIVGLYDGKVYIYKNRGGGGFGSPVLHGTIDRIIDFRAADINNDGHLDIVSGNQTGIDGNYSYSLSLHAGTGDGGFQNKGAIPINGTFSGMTLDDFNGDSLQDIAVSRHYGDYSGIAETEIFINNGDGTFTSRWMHQYSKGSVSKSGDFNNGGKTDLIERGYTADEGETVFLWLGNGDGTFNPTVHYGLNGGRIGVPGDFNLDGKLDIAAPSRYKITFLLNQLSPLRTPPLPPAKLKGTAGDGTVSLSWAANAEEDMAGYNVYRSLSAGGGYVKLNNALLYATSYTDYTATNGTTYYYTVSAVDKDGDESSYAFKVKAIPNPPDTIPPVVKITSPVNSGTVYSPNLFVLGTINEADSKVTVNSITGTVQKRSGTFTAYGIPLNAGENTITVTAVDAAGNGSTDSIKVIYVPTASISGVVRDETTGQPIQGAYISVIDSEKTQSLSPGVDGRYFFSKLIPGEVTIIVDSSNYDRITLNKTILSGEALNLDILLPLYPATLRGAVYNYYTYQPIAGATVTVTDRKKTQSVIAWGNYEVTNITPYDVTITLAKEGYETYTETRTLSNQYTNWGYYYLKALPPSVPTGIAAVPGVGFAELTWSPNPEGNISGYNIYRTTTPGAGYTKLNWYPAAAPSYKDTSVTGGVTYYYVITAVNTSWRESGYSIEVSATPAPPLPPAGLTATPGTKRVDLVWNAIQTDIFGYNIYRSTASGTGYAKINSSPVTTLSYMDTTVTGGNTYYYVVTSIAVSYQESAYSSEASATPTAPKLLISITSPMDGASAYASSVLLTGTIERSLPEVGIVIETTANKTSTSRQLANVNGNSFAALIALQEGVNMIRAMAKDSEGNQAESMITVYASMTQEAIRLTATPESGIMTLKTVSSPYPSKEGFPMPQTYALDVTLRVEAYLPNPIASYSWDFNGDGRPEQTGSLSEVTTTYYSTGLYYPTVTVTDSKGNTYTATTVVNVLSKDEIDSILKGKWEGMKGALISGDTTTAATYIFDSQRSKYKEVFDSLKAQLQAIFSQTEDFVLVSVSDNRAEYENIVVEDGTAYSYPVIFVKDGNGLWKIRGF